MHETKNLELLNKIESLEGSTKLYFKDADDKEYSLIARDVIVNDNNVSAITILCKMYDVDSINNITFVRGCFVDDKLKNVGHIIYDEWLLSIIQSISRYGTYFKYVYDSINISNNNITVFENIETTENVDENIIEDISDEFFKNSDVKHELTVLSKANEILTPFDRNIYHVYNDKLILQINRQKPRKNTPKIVYIELDKKLLNMLSKAEWQFALDNSGRKLYIPGSYYENQTHSDKYGGKNQINMSKYCYGCDPRFIRINRLSFDYFVIKTERKPFTKSEFNENINNLTTLLQ